MAPSSRQWARVRRLCCPVDAVKPASQAARCPSDHRAATANPTFLLPVATHATGAMFILGGGDRPALHTHEYDFNDKTIANGASVFLQALAIRHAA